MSVFASRILPRLAQLGRRGTPRAVWRFGLCGWKIRSVNRNQTWQSPGSRNLQPVRPVCSGPFSSALLSWSMVVHGRSDGSPCETLPMTGCCLVRFRSKTPVVPPILLLNYTLPSNPQRVKEELQVRSGGQCLLGLLRVEMSNLELLPTGKVGQKRISQKLIIQPLGQAVGFHCS